MDALAWAQDAAARLEGEFGPRLSFVGLQGSRARGEATETSDIDLVVLVDDLCADDLGVYRRVIESMPHAELACGFVGSPAVLENWPRHELFQFVNDTVSVCGRLPFSPADFTRDDACEAARIGASGIYHATCHALVFDGEARADILRELAKSAVFVLQALHFARTGAYLRTRSELSDVLEGMDAEVLEWAIRAKGMSELVDDDVRELAELLLDWSSAIILAGNA